MLKTVEDSKIFYYMSTYVNLTKSNGQNHALPKLTKYAFENMLSPQANSLPTTFLWCRVRCTMFYGMYKSQIFWIFTNTYIHMIVFLICDCTCN